MVLPINEDTTTIGARARTTLKVSTAVEWNSGADFDLYVITGGPILVRYLYGVVSTTMGVGNAIPQLQYTSLDGAVATVMDLAMAAIAGHVDGSIYVWSGAVGNQMAPAAALGHADSAEYEWQTLGNFCILAPGTIDIINGVLCNAGEVDWYLTWIPLRSGCAVTAQ